MKHSDIQEEMYYRFRPSKPLVKSNIKPITYWLIGMFLFFIVGLILVGLYK